MIGREGQKLKTIELQTATKISVPRSDNSTDIIKIVGTREGVDKARHQIQLISDEQVSSCPHLPRGEGVRDRLLWWHFLFHIRNTLYRPVLTCITTQCPLAKSSQLAWPLPQWVTELAPFVRAGQPLQCPLPLPLSQSPLLHEIGGTVLFSLPD